MSKAISGLASVTAWAQGLYFIVTGIWPLAHMQSFLTITGPKTDLWLVKTVGVLVIVIGAVILMAGRRGALTLEIFVLAVGSALMLAGVDVIYVAQKRIWPSYLIDAVLQLIFITVWTTIWKRQTRTTQASQQQPDMI